MTESQQVMMILIGGSVGALVAIMQGSVSVVLWKKAVRDYGSGDKKRKKLIDRNSESLSLAAALGAVSFGCIFYGLFFNTINGVSLIVLEVGAFLLSLGCAGFMKCKIRQTLCKEDFSLTPGERDLAIEKDQEKIKLAGGFVLAGLIIILYTLFA